MKIGDIYWVVPTKINGITSSSIHPYVVIDIDAAEIHETVIVCALTTNLRKLTVAGNILLEVGEANLPKQSIVEVSKRFRLPIAELQDYVGTLSEQRIHQILSGIQFVEQSFLNR